MDDIRASFFKLKKGVKDRLKGSKRKADKKRADGRGTDTDNDSVEPGASADESGLDWGSTVSSTAKLLLRGVRDSADAFAPLKSVAGGLCFILENCEVSSLPYTLSTPLTGAPANEGKQTGDRIVGTPGRGTRKITLPTYFKR